MDECFRIMYSTIRRLIWSALLSIIGVALSKHRVDAISSTDFLVLRVVRTLNLRDRYHFTTYARNERRSNIWQCKRTTVTRKSQNPDLCSGWRLTRVTSIIPNSNSLYLKKRKLLPPHRQGPMYCLFVVLYKKARQSVRSTEKDLL